MKGAYPGMTSDGAIPVEFHVAFANGGRPYSVADTSSPNRRCGNSMSAEFRLEKHGDREILDAHRANAIAVKVSPFCCILRRDKLSLQLCEDSFMVFNPTRPSKPKVMICRSGVLRMVFVLCNSCSTGRTRGTYFIRLTSIRD